MNYTFVHRPNRAPGGPKDTIRFPFRVDTIEAFHGFQQTGYIKVCYIPDAGWLKLPYWWLGSLRNIFYLSDGEIKTEGDNWNIPRINLNSAA